MCDGRAQFIWFRVIVIVRLLTWDKQIYFSNSANRSDITLIIDVVCLHDVHARGIALYKKWCLFLSVMVVFLHDRESFDLGQINLFFKFQ